MNVHTGWDLHLTEQCSDPFAVLVPGIYDQFSKYEVCKTLYVPEGKCFNHEHMDLGLALLVSVSRLKLMMQSGPR